MDRLLRASECPFTWDSLTPDMEDLEQYVPEANMKGLEPMEWNDVILKVRLATAFCLVNSVRSERVSRRYIVEAYMRFLPALMGTCEEGDLVQEYTLALKHLVDATWAHVCRDFHGYDPAAMRHLEAFLKHDMVHYGTLRDHVKAALFAIRADMAAFPENITMARKAVEMNPKEGQWHCTLAKALYTSRLEMKEQGVRWLYSVQEEKSAAQKAYQLVKNPEVYLTLARINEDLGYFSKVVELLREGTAAFPDNVCLLWQAGDLVRELPKQHRDQRLALRWYEQALKKDPDCGLVHGRLSELHLERGDPAAAKPHSREAARLGAAHKRCMQDSPEESSEEESSEQESSEEDCEHMHHFMINGINQFLKGHFFG